MTQVRRAERAERTRVYLAAVRGIVGPQWTAEGCGEGDGDAKRRSDAKTRFIDAADAFAAWLYKQSSPTSEKDGLLVLRANVERYAKSLFDSTLEHRDYGPAACTKWLRNHGLAPSTKPAPKTLPPLDVTAPSRPRVTVVNLERAAEQRRMAAEAMRAAEEACGRARPPLAKTREQLAELERRAGE